MTTDNSGVTGNRFVLKTLPWLIGAGGVLVYFITLNPWLSAASLGPVARISGWLWRPELGPPLTLLVFAPFRLLPEAARPLALNLATAICAGLVLVQLARSVVILRQDVAPHDLRRKDQSAPAILIGPWAWMPPVFAAVAGGLQLGFWEHATSASGEMPGLLCFAFAWRGLLEFRVTGQQKWLSRSALVYAAGLTDNWLMLGYLPVFVAGIIWVKDYSSFLDLRFLLRMSGWALVGLSLYLLVPIGLWGTAPEQWDFWPTLKTYLVAQRNALWVLRSQAFRLLTLTGLLPFFLLAVRWRSHTVQLADDTRPGVFFAKASGHGIHGLFFVTALWIALNPMFTPRQLELNPPLLVYFYPWAMVAGYGVGYLLLFRLPHQAQQPAKWPAFAAALLLGLLAATLIWKNLGDIQLTNGRAVQEFARQLYDDLPAGPVVVLSDELQPLLLLRAELAAQGREKKPLLIDTRSLPRPEYHRRLSRDYGSRWPAGWPTNRVAPLGPAQMVAFVHQIATREPVVYLHPSSGLFLEDFAAEPHGWIQRLGGRPRVPSEPAVATNERLWQQRWTEGLAAQAAQWAARRERGARWSRPPLKALKLSSRPNATAMLLAGPSSKVLNHWGTLLQRSGRDAEAAEWFQRAIALDPDNLAARINLEFATRRQQEETARLTLAWIKNAFPNVLGRYETWAEVISRGGPVDEPTCLLESGRMYLAAGHPRQALEAFARSSELAPDWIAPQLWQAQSQNRLGNFAAARALTDDLSASAAPLKSPTLAQLLQIRTVALCGTGQTNEAIAYLDWFATTHQQATEVVATAAELCAAAGRWPAELKWREVLRQRDPNRVDWLVKQGLAELRQGEFATAILTLTRALTLAPADGNARLFRAIAALQAGRFKVAQGDYQELLKQRDFSQSALFGLGGIAWREHDTNALIQYYQTFLSNNAAATPQAAVASQRLKEWREE